MDAIINLDESYEIVGKVKRYIFHNGESGYSVAVLKLSDLDEKKITITGYFPKFDKDDTYMFSGNYVEHIKFGVQFSIVTFKKVQENDTDSLIKLLSGPLFPGIGKKFAENMIDTLGNDLIELINEDNNILDKVNKMTEKKKKIIVDGLNEENYDLLSYLQSFGLGIRNTMKIQSVYGDRAASVIKENPYQLVEDIDGLGFLTADKLAMALGFAKDNPLRLKALVLDAIMKITMSSGDSYISFSVLCSKLSNQLSNEDVSTYLNELVNNKLVYIVENKIYHHSQFMAENYISSFLNKLNSEQTDEIAYDYFKELLNDVEKDFSITYDEIQVDAIFTAITSNIIVLTGGPGTGKTTVVKAIVSLLKRINTNHNLIVCAPTGRAAKRLNELTGQDASTIHSLLKWNLETNTFGKNINDPLGYETIIIDECSMVDSWLLYNLFLASKNVSRFIFIGDVNQLPSVSPGAILRDIIQSDNFSVIELNKIYRQKDGSAIIQLAHDIQYNQEDITFDNDVKFIDSASNNVKNYAISLIENALSKGYSVNDIQILSCKYSGISGIDNLNITLQKKYNPEDKDKNEIRHGSRIFRENDKVLLLKNMIDDNVFNGDIGTIVEIDVQQPRHKSSLIVDFDGNIVEFTYDNFDKLTLAYCISVHKSQGSEYPIVILSISNSDFFMLDRKLIYTAITRASKLLVILGDRQLFMQAIKLNEKYSRKTRLVELLVNI